MQSQAPTAVTECLVTSNGEWVPEHTEEELRESAAVRLTLSALNAIAVIVPVVATFFDGWTRGGSPSIFGKFGGYGRVAETVVLLVALGPLEQRLDVPDRVVDARVHVAELGEPGRHRRDGEVRHLDIG